MAKKNSQEYWRERAEKIIEQEEKHDDEVLQDVKDITNEMLSEIETEIYKFYAKYAESEGISLKEAKKKIDETDIRDFESRVKKYVKDKDMSEKANRELKQYNTKMYVSREKMLMQQIEVIMKHGTGLLDNEMYMYLEDAAQREVKRQSGVIGESVQLQPSVVRAIINAKFDEQNWSDRLWNNMEEVQKEVKRTASHVLLRGRHPNEFVSEFRKKFNVTEYEARRLLITETARVQSEAQKIHYKQTLGDDGEVEFIAKLDKKTTKQCRGMDGKKFKVSELIPGINMPPLHPFCRSSTAPAVTDWRDEFFDTNDGDYDLDDFFNIEEDQPEEKTPNKPTDKPNKKPDNEIDNTKPQSKPQPKPSDRPDKKPNKPSNPNKPNKKPSDTNNKPNTTTKPNEVNNTGKTEPKKPKPKDKEIDEIIDVVENDFVDDLNDDEIEIVVDTLESIKPMENKIEIKKKLKTDLDFLPFSLLALLIKLLEAIGVL